MPDRPKLIVTGLSGLLGSRLTRLASPRFELVNIDITEGIDITDPDQVRKAIEPHRDAAAVVHLAAFTNVSAAAEQEGDESGTCYRINVIGTRNVAGVCEAAGLHLLHVSTDFIFDGEKEGPYTEDDSPHPIEWYGRTKGMAEREARNAPAWTILRTAFPYVAGPAPRPDLIRNIRQRLAAGEEARLFTDQIITPTFADDLVRGIMLLARTRPHGELFHLVGSTSLSPFELGRKIAATFGFDEGLVRPSSLVEYLKTDPRPRQRCLRMSNAKWSALARSNGLEPPLSIDEGLARVREEED